MSADPTFLALQTALAGRFSLEREIGRGGMGVVYLAHDVRLERLVAIKLLAPALAARPEMRRRFLREARLAAQCFHPNIVPIHEVTEAGDLAWFVMGYVAGETLAERLRRTGPLPVDAVRRLGREIGWALAYAHERGVVHRDVKPENILLEDGSDRALIADFGIAVADDGPHASGEVAGTARFMAPEQALGETLDGRADLYALGVTLHLAATGAYPERGGSADRRALAARPLSALPPALADVIDRCLALMPTERFDDAPAFVAALDAVPHRLTLSPEVRDVRPAASATAALVGWTVAMSTAGVFMVLGEAPRSFGRSITESLAQATVTFMAIATALRAGETLLLARRAARRGATDEMLAHALAPAPDEYQPVVRPTRALLMVLAGAALAYAQASVDEMHWPGWLEFLGNATTWLLPTILVQRAVAGVAQEGRVSGWLERPRRALATRLAQWLGARRGARHTPTATMSQTEIRLGHAAEEIFARLPEAQRTALRALPAATARLAEDAVRLRAEAARISGEQRAVRRAAHADPDAAQRLAAEHEAVTRRLQTTVAALEAIRLDLLRLEASRTMPGALTEDFEVVRDLQRRVDADADVRRVLREPRIPLAPEPTPV